VEDASLPRKIYSTLQSTLYRYENIISSAPCRAEIRCVAVDWRKISQLV